MKRFISLLLSLFLVGLLSSAAFAQTKKRKTTTRRRAPVEEPAPKPILDMRPEAMAVAEQLKNVSKFVFIYGKIVNGLEVAEEQTRRGQMTAAAAAKNKQTREALIASINSLRVGIEGVSKSFQANPRMQVQYLKLSYASESTASAEQLALAGRFDEAGKALVTAVERLTDTILSMRLQ
ncbi:MAG: hypothetical protein SF339_12190 [Blastocatellia bacterium]|nr:hypothetical protein [Blastocatellia bacterium]